VITSTVLEVFRQARQVKATGKVSTSYLQPSGTSSSSVDSVSVTISADSLDYRDEDRKAIYRGDVVLQADQTRMEADRLEVLFASNKKGETRRIEEANGEGEVRIFQPGLRAEGQQMEYLPEPGKIVLRGGPPVAYDEERGMTTGERLTFSLSDDSMSVYGGENSPAFTRHRMAR
jgi:lipopolysaccharide transport protein LptA